MLKLEIKDLFVQINDTKNAFLKNINFCLKQGDLAILYGKNGAGKSTLLKAIMHHYSTKILNGSILFNNENYTKSTTYDMANNGFFHMLQYPIEINGIQSLAFLRIINEHNKNQCFEDLFNNVNNLLNKYDLPNEILSRDVNVDFSGGQKKKFELIQASITPYKVLLIDEIDSGVDKNTIHLLAKYINENKKNCITIVISHNDNFIKSLQPNKVIFLNDGEIIKIGNIKLLSEIEKKGYNHFVKNNNKEINMIGQKCLLKKYKNE